jgi:hypothetical protein
MNIIHTRCRGCDYTLTAHAYSYNGQDLGVLIHEQDRCPRCAGRMQSLFLRSLVRQKSSW